MQFNKLHFFTKDASLGEDLLHRMDQRDTWDRFYSEKRATGPRHFDWFFSYREVSGLLLSTLQGLSSGETRILDVGCGTSALGLGLYRDSPHQLHISCLDFSPLALDSLSQLIRESPPPRHPLSQLCCHLADATDLGATFESSSFHLVLDKGTCDTLLRCPQGPGRAKQLVTECLRVLKPQGKLLQFSDEDPDARVPFLEQAGGANVTVTEIGHINGICYYVYMLGQRPLDLADGREQSLEGKGLKTGPACLP
ncbi:citrate synthase-lysine N-methyltransferase CSKMT, mitochondrial isoform X2 [Eublepharis macularius]|uniref:Citrate synthase-lysine N-methyltransferase CSKMT, mitochondrial n=1 Tax=Eublepharis macularius TaxID=481883 RepID=A0AA97JVF7_EUBMA|nr:citrate synthase-lysine N-methyltransferase CSKMT, mitochondrial isoform X2 [Eublepharis macularius]